MGGAGMQGDDLHELHKEKTDVCKFVVIVFWFLDRWVCKFLVGSAVRRVWDAAR